MRYQQIFLFLLLILASCSNYNNIRFVNSGEYSASQNEAAIDKEDSPCDTIYLTSGEVQTVAVLQRKPNKIKVISCDSERNKDFINIEEVDKICYSSGLVWPALKNKCDTLILNDGTTQLGKVVSFDDGFVRVKNCENPRSSESRIQFKAIDHITYSSGKIDDLEEALNEQEKQTSDEKKNRHLIRFIVFLSLAVIFGVLAIILATAFTATGFMSALSNSIKSITAGILGIVGLLFLILSILSFTKFRKVKNKESYYSGSLKNPELVQNETKTKRENALIAGFIVNFILAFICGILAIIAFQPFIAFGSTLSVVISVFAGTFLILGLIYLGMYLGTR